MEWQDISTAPNDDTEVLVFNGHRCDVAWIGWHDEGRPVYFNGDCQVYATHWMPLPSPPKPITPKEKD